MRTSTYTLTDNFFGPDSQAVTVHASDDDLPALILQAMHQSGEQPGDITAAINELADAISHGGALEAATRDIATGLGITIAAV